jgi:hypothetical protein
MLCSLATRLSPEDLQTINALEKELGTPLLAYSCRAELKPASIGPEQVEKIQAVENRLGLVLVAVQG